MKVVIIGEQCTDVFIYGEVTRLSPEAPVPVLIPSKTITNPGMAGNVTVNIKALVPDSEIVCIFQEDKIYKTRYVEEKSNHMFIRIDEGENNITPFVLNEETIKIINESDIVIVSDYNKGFLSDDDLKKISQNSLLSILDSKRKLTNDIIKHFTFVKLNEDESLNNLSLDFSKIIVTLGKQGAKYKNINFPSPRPQETIDVSGAGDTFTSSFIIKYFLTKDIKTSILYANEKSSEVVSKRGVTFPL